MTGFGCSLYCQEGMHERCKATNDKAREMCTCKCHQREME